MYCIQYVGVKVIYSLFYLCGMPCKTHLRFFHNYSNISAALIIIPVILWFTNQLPKAERDRLFAPHDYFELKV